MSAGTAYRGYHIRRERDGDFTVTRCGSYVTRCKTYPEAVNYIDASLRPIPELAPH